MTGARLPQDSEWRQFLRLGEELLKQPNAVAQSNLIAETVSTRLGCEARLWLASPYYPLAGEPKIETLPTASAPEIVQRAFSSREPSCADHDPDEPGTCGQAALPLISQDHLLGVLHVWCTDKRRLKSNEISYLNGLTAHSALTMQFTRQVTIKNWRYEQLSLVSSVSTQVANVLDLNELCRRVTALIQETFDYYYVGIFTFDSEKNQLFLQAGASQMEDVTLSPGFIVNSGEGITGFTTQTGQELICPDVRVEPRYRYTDMLPGTRSEAVIPLKVENRILGVLDVQSDELDAFHEMDVMVLRALSDNIALAIEGTHLYRNMQRHNEQLAAVFAITHAITSILDLDMLLDEVVSLIKQRFNFPFVHIFTVHPGRSKLIYRSGSGERSRAMHDLDLQYDLNDPVGIIPYVARTGKLKMSNDVSQEPLYRESELPPLNTRAEMAVPLIFGGDVLGVLDIQNDQINVFTDNDVSLFEALASSVALAIRNATLYRSERWRRQTADSLRDIASLISANVALDTLLDRILLELERNLPCDASAIWLIDEASPAQNGEKPNIRLAAVHGIKHEIMTSSFEHSRGESHWILQALDSNRPIIRKNKDPYGPLGTALNAPRTYSSIAAPLRAGDKSLGLLTLAHRDMGRYGGEAQAMTATFASYAAVAIRNARLFSDAQAQAWISTVLLQVAETSQASRTVDDLLSSMVRLTPLLVGVKKCAIFLWEESRQAFVLKSWYGISVPSKSSLQFDEHTTPAFARLRATQAPIYIENAAAELNLPTATVSANIGTLVIMPLLAHGSLLGAFLVAHETSRHPTAQHNFDQQTLAILQGITHQTAVALENLSLLEARQEEGYVTAVMLQVAQSVANQNNLDDILDTIVHLMPILVGIDACLIYLWDGTQNEFYPAQVYTGNHDEEEAMLCSAFAPGQYELLDKVFQGHTLFSPISDPDLPWEEWPDLVSISAEDFSTLSAYSSSSWLIGFPLTVKGETFGVLLAKDRGSSPAFRERRLEIISGVAQQVALAIQNERLKEEMIERERMDREFQLAREIQQTFLPSYMPRIHGWEVDARWQTARTVGGDFYDIFRIDRYRLGLVIADVSDKGMPAALYMTVTRTLIRANVPRIDSPAELLREVNNLLVIDAQNGMYVTAVYAVLDTRTGVITYANAGHNQPLFLQRKTGSAVRLFKGGMALAVLEDMQYQDRVLQMEPGDCLMLYTDGITEQFDADGEMYGEERLLAFLSAASGKTVNSLIDSLNHELVTFREGEPPSDDVTMLVVRRLETADDDQQDNEISLQEEGY
jgi:phosphoserine phosphatase RsbU/P